MRQDETSLSLSLSAILDPFVGISILISIRFSTRTNYTRSRSPIEY